MFETMLELWAWGKMIELAFGGLMIAASLIAFAIFGVAHFHNKRKIKRLYNSK